MNSLENRDTQQEIFGERAEKIEALKSIIQEKEFRGEDVINEKIELIGAINNIQYSSEEKAIFDQWNGNLQANSLEEPIKVENIDSVVASLPDAANYTEKPVNLFFSFPSGYSHDDLCNIMRSFSLRNPNFEISITEYPGGVISVGIGDKTRDKSMRMDGKYYGHYHPLGNFALENPDTLPHSFVGGLLPSPGDIRGFLKNPDAVDGGTRIFSTRGSVLLTPHVQFEDPEKIVDEYKRAYFDLFLGKNSLGIRSDEEVAEYFRKHFQMDIEFDYQ